MEPSQVLIISFWNPVPEIPQQGIFIQDQVAAVCLNRKNVVFLQVNVLNSRNIFVKKTVEETDFFNGKRITINLYTRLWKFWYVNPWLLERVIYKAIISCTTKIAPALIHTNVIFPCGITGYLLSKRFGAATIISEHWSKVEKLMRNPIYSRTARKAYREAKAIICVSEFLAGKIRIISENPNTFVIPNIVDTDIFNYKPKLKDTPNTIKFLCIGNWRLPKRLDLIVEALIRFAEGSNKEIKLKVVGNGAQADSFKNIILPGNLKIGWMGYLDKNSIAGLLHSTDFFLHASDIETFSIVTAEALATGSPVVASKTGALPELVNETNGVLSENTVEAWLDAINEITSRQFDHEAIAIRNQERFSVRNVSESIMLQYR
jgi:glycosyltransferase involved in cell wall biosynthesis